MTNKAIPAGNFSTWLEETREALKNDTGTDVPCGECNACCRSHYFIHIKPEDKAAQKKIPKAIQFPAPGLPKGNMLLGYDQHGRCPMLKDNKCSIYLERPSTCRTYDCRVFPATGINETESEKEAIKRQSDRWVFSYANNNEIEKHKALKGVANFLVTHRDQFPKGFVPLNAPQVATLAIKIHETFLSGETAVEDESSVKETIKSILTAYKTKPLKPNK